jgi:hypothetical protein
MKETWKVSNWLEDDYEISSYGRVRRLTPGQGTWVGRIRKLVLQPDGYLRIHLSCHGKKHLYIGVHQLVAEAFLGPCPPGKEVNHKDGNKKNNFYKNLEYMTAKENKQHAVRMGLAPVGEDHYFSKLTVEKVKAIRRAVFKEGKMHSDKIAKDFGISKATIRDVCKRSWRHVQ